MQIGELLKAWLWENKYTLDDVCDDIGIKKSTLSRICSGKKCDSETMLTLIEWLFRER